VLFSQLFRSFRPLQNPIGFGAADFVLLSFALLFSLVLLLRPLVWPHIVKLGERTFAAMVALAALAVVLRLALFASSPAPLPSGADDFGYVLLADTLGHFRMANPTHPLHQFFEAVFILQQPTYSSIYPLGQGLVLAIGCFLFGSFWAGVLLSAAAFCALCFWMLRGWLSPKWAFAGGLLTVMQFGPLNSWTNTYWGGAVSACAGCLTFGALPRMRRSLEDPDPRMLLRYGALLGAGLAVQLLTRPFEFVLLLVSVLVYCLSVFSNLSRLKLVSRALAVALAMMFGALLLTLVQNRSVTGSYFTLPYMLSRYQYGVPTSFTFQPNPQPHRALTSEQDLDYRAQAAIHGPGGDSLKAWFARLLFRFRYLRFFLFPPLYLALFFFVPSLRRAQWAWVAGTAIFFLAGTNFYPYFFPHYVAAIAPLLILIALKGLENCAHLSTNGGVTSRLLIALCGAHFLFWYCIHISASERLLPATRYETGDYINSDDPDGRIAVNQQLSRISGQQLVFVHYSPSHRFQEWIANRAVIDSARIVWALDLGSQENQNLIRYFPSRKYWLLEPDMRPPRLTPYDAQATTFESVH
jgi:hypothetical protein